MFFFYVILTHFMYDKSERVIIMCEHKNMSILVGVDDSPLAKKAFEHALHLAKKEHATLYVVSVINDNHINVGSDEYVATQSFFELEDKSIRQAFHQLQEEAKQENVILKGIIAYGNPKHILAKKLPEKYHIDTIIIGGPEKTMDNYFGLGSVATYVISHSPCNVYIIKE